MVSLSELGRLKRRVAPTIKILRAENQIVFPVSTSTTLLSHSTFLLQASLIQPPIIYINAYPRSQFPSPFVRTPRVNFHGLTRSLLSSFSMPHIIRIVSRYVYHFLCLKSSWHPCPDLSSLLPILTHYEDGGLLNLIGLSPATYGAPCYIYP